MSCKIAQFKTQPIEKRIFLSNKLLSSYPDKIPVIVARGNTFSPEIKKNKFLFPKGISFAKVIVDLRKFIPNLKSSEAVFFFLENSVIPQNSILIDKIYELYKTDDGFLYIYFTSENTFG